MFIVSAFYKFTPFPLENLSQWKEDLEAHADNFKIGGLVLLGAEGCNGTVAGPRSGIESFKEALRALPGCDDLMFKESESARAPFRRFKVDIRPEIVTLKQEVPRPEQSPSHLPPKEWQAVLDSGEDVLVLDTRNWYETAIGKFKSAVDPKLAKFSEFPEYVEKLDTPKEKKILMYCTGGIRCEKAIFEMHKRGFNNVFQLEGGILKYLEEFPNRDFEGECFVFDHRVSVDQALQPSQQYALCPHCGDPAATLIPCVRCSTEAKVCEKCLKDPAFKTCSKNCAYHVRKGSRNKQRVAS